MGGRGTFSGDKFLVVFFLGGGVHHAACRILVP